MLHSVSLSLPILSSSHSGNLKRRSHSHTHTLTPNRNPLYLKFRTAYRENLRYLKTLGVIHPEAKPNKLPLPDAVDHYLATVNFLKSKGFSDADFPRLAFLCPQLFSIHMDSTDIAPVFDFLAVDLAASVRSIARLDSPIGIEDLMAPTNLNAHLLNMRVEKLRGKIRFLHSIGFSHEEAATACARLPAIFGYGIETNLQPKFEYLVKDMNRNVKELKDFPQYFGFSLEKRIMPRHLHLKQRKVDIPLNRMLMWGDQKFYAKWK
ncbi:Transcription termination factor family protein [Quillaja saponaria]|uniref:Transcription termination factor family protein n=1 Tax=Quillaja saponaria TaxID=32244 RepID=A0AAD7VJT5_QUISA|nr:Transcription termination factor family protein [Quillaja saponaria]